MHIHHALQQGIKTVEVRSVDTDVVVTFIGAFYELVKTQSSAYILVAFGTGRNTDFWSINAIYNSLGEPKSRACAVLCCDWL